ncbi:MAG: FAD-binding oxidoreductase [Candidatus Rokubacteria bacterium]|nr:FAD-binding oxidoreductase [Candidatus Rokubacteria bacterium]
MTRPYDVAVIGTGMLGAPAAYRLARAGRRVIALEARAPAEGTSGSSFAWINAVRKEPEAYHRLNADGVAQYDGLADELGADIGYVGGGCLEWAGADGEQDELRERVARLAGRGYPAEWLDRAAALEIQPNLAIGSGTRGVAFYPRTGWVDAPRLIRAFLQLAVANGAEVRPRTPARSLRVRADRITCITTDQGDVLAGEVLVAAGTATPDLLEPLGVTLPVRRVPGLLAVTSPPDEPLTRVVYAPGVHLRPDVSGGLLLGAPDVDRLVTEETRLDTAAGLAQPLLDRARQVFPPARSVHPVAVRIGIRPVPADGHTIGGRVPGFRNAWVLVTHSGITLGPLLGRLIAAEITGGAPSPQLAPFRPDRFAGSVLDRSRSAR